MFVIKPTEGYIIISILLIIPIISIMRMFILKRKYEIIIKNKSYSKYFSFIFPLSYLIIIIIYETEFNIYSALLLLLYFVYILLETIFFSDGIVEEGFYYGTGVLKWNKMESYKWLNKKQRKSGTYYVLRIIKPNKIMFDLVIKNEDTEKVENLLIQNKIIKIFN